MQDPRASTAYYLARAGFAPVIYEDLLVPGGMLYVGIPEYRLPKAILRQEVADRARRRSATKPGGLQNRFCRGTG